MIGPMSDDLPLLFDEFEDAISVGPWVAQLRAIRDRLDTHELSEAVRHSVDRINDPARVGIVKNSILRCRRTTEELRSRRKELQETTRTVGIAGGIGVTGGAVVAAVALAAPVLAIIPFVAGALLSARSIQHSKMLSEEITVLDQIASRLEIFSGY